MAVELRTYNSPTEIIEAIESEIVQTVSTLGGYLRRLDEIRSLAEKSRKIREIVFNFAGKKETQDNFNELTIGSLDIVLDANSWNELAAIKEAVRSQEERLLELQKAREAIKWVNQIGNIDGFKYLVLENDRVQKKILIQYPKEKYMVSLSPSSSKNSGFHLSNG